MEKKRISINGIPAIIWGEDAKKVFIAVHGNMSCKEDKVIEMLAKYVTQKEYQVLSFDLPEHGERKGDKTYLCKVQNCVEDLKQVIEYAKANFDEINLWACSIGAYFSMLAYKDENIKKSLFLSPVVNMKAIIDNMMKWSNVTEEELKEKQQIETDFGQTLYWDYYEYVKENPIEKRNSRASILYGANDDLQSQENMQEFVKKFGCELTVLEDGEHYFHTDEQLERYRKWMEEEGKNGF
jgi:esterase/lipase